MLPINDEVAANVEQSSHDSTKPSCHDSSKFSIDDLLKLTIDDSPHGSMAEMGFDQPKVRPDQPKVRPDQPKVSPDQPKVRPQSTVSTVGQSKSPKTSVLEDTKNVERNASAVNSTNSPLKDEQQPTEHVGQPESQTGAHHCNPGFRTQGDHSESSSDDQLDSSQNPERPPLEGAPETIPSFRGLEAELVDTNGEMERLEEELLRNLQNEAVVAEVVVKTAPNKFRRYCTIISVLLAFAVASLVTGILVSNSSRDSPAPTMSPTLPPDERISQLVAFFNEVTRSNGTIAYPPGSLASPEEMALEWIIDTDPLRLTLEDKDRLLQRFALVCLWTGNPGSTLDDDWLQDESECSWSGVDCDASLANVVGLTLSNKNLVNLPEDFGFLSHVQYIDLVNNGLTGTIPSSIAFMANLTAFHVVQNQLSGTIPWDVFSNMSNLEYFTISENNLVATLPSSISSWWPRLKTFSIHRNKIDGSIPNEFAVWSDLVMFSVGWTDLAGTLPSSIGLWTNLKVFSVEGTSINGTLPAAISDWKLEYFNVWRSKLTGTIPEEIGNWRNITAFTVDTNDFSGTIPASIQNWRNVQHAIFSNNKFTGTMPLCDIENKALLSLVSDCEALNCTCCLHCCPGSWNGIPRHQQLCD